MKSLVLLVLSTLAIAATAQRCGQTEGKGLKCRKGFSCLEGVCRRPCSEADTADEAEAVLRPSVNGSNVDDENRSVFRRCIGDQKCISQVCRRPCADTASCGHEQTCTGGFCMGKDSPVAPAASDSEERETKQIESHEPVEGAVKKEEVKEEPVAKPAPAPVAAAAAAAPAPAAEHAAAADKPAAHAANPIRNNLKDLIATKVRTESAAAAAAEKAEKEKEKAAAASAAADANKKPSDD